MAVYVIYLNAPTICAMRSVLEIDFNFLYIFHIQSNIVIRPSYHLNSYPFFNSVFSQNRNILTDIYKLNIAHYKNYFKYFIKYFL